jgi:hypothetical protein
MTTFQIGAAFYILWGLLHIKASADAFRFAGTQPPGMARGRLFQGASDLGFFALTAIVVGVSMNWNNSLVGYWLNLAIVSAADVAFVAFVLRPGYMPLFPGAIGPALWLLGVLFTTIGILQGG